MATLDLTTYGEVSDDPQFGSRVPVSITFTTGTVFKVEDVVVADNYGTKLLWTSPNGGLTTFEFGLILSDKDIFVELRNDDSGTPEYVLMKVLANIPFFFGSKIGGGTTERLDALVLVDNTDYADVDRIEVQRDAAEGQGDATVSCFLFT